MCHQTISKGFIEFQIRKSQEDFYLHVRISAIIIKDILKHSVQKKA